MCFEPVLTLIYLALPTMLDLRNIPMWLKISLSPFLSILILLVLLFQTSGVLDRQLQSTDQIINQNMAAALNLSEVVARLRGANGRLYQLISLSASGASDVDFATELEKVSADAEKVRASLAEFQSKYASEEEKQQVEEILPALDQLTEAIGFVSSLLELDFSAAVNTLEPFNQQYAAIDTQLGNFIQQQRRQAVLAGDTSLSDAESALSTLYTISAIAILLSVGATLLIVRTTVLSINTITNATTRLAQGEEDLDLHALERGDELGDVVNALAVFRDHIKQSRELQEQQQALQLRQMEEERKMAEEQQRRQQEELVQQAAEEERQRAERKQLLNTLADQFQSQVGAVIESVSVATVGMKDQSGSMRSLSDESVRISVEIGSAMNQSNDSVQTVASGIEELSSSIQEITRQVQSSGEIARGAVEQANDTNATVAELSNTAARIGQIINVINEIAEQTNLLALNATIEAARAGDAGRGFAVVASEVKSLATQTAKATEEIAAQITSMQTVANTSVDAIGKICETIQKMDEITGTISVSVDEQSTAASEISRSIQQAADSTRVVNTNMDTLSASSRATGDAAATVYDLSEDLNSQAHALTAHVNEFVKSIRTA